MFKCWLMSLMLFGCEVCRETDRFRVPKPGVDLNRLKYRLTVILNRESENVEGFGGTLKSGNY